MARVGSEAELDLRSVQPAVITRRDVQRAGVDGSSIQIGQIGDKLGLVLAKVPCHTGCHLFGALIGVTKGARIAFYTRPSCHQLQLAGNDKTTELKPEAVIEEVGKFRPLEITDVAKVVFECRGPSPKFE